MGRCETAAFLAAFIALLAGAFPVRAMETYAKSVSADRSQERLSDGVMAFQEADSDSEGLTFVTGAVRGGAEFAPGLGFGAKTVTGKDEPYDAFVAQLDPGGRWAWARRVLTPLVSSTAGLNGPAVTTPTNGLTVKDLSIGKTNVYLAGFLNSSKRVGFVVQLDRAGAVIWTRYVIASSHAVVNAVAEGRHR